jgi:PAS domain S-box-containing protein
MKKKELVTPTIILILIFFILTGNLFYIKYNNYKSLLNLENGVNISIQLSNLVHELQKERGMSTGYISSNGKKFKEQLKIQRILTDKRVKIYYDTLRQNNSSLPLEVKKSLLNTNSYINEIKLLRKQIDDFCINAKTAIKVFSDINDNLLAPMVTISQTYKLADISQSMVAYTNFLYYKEHVGIERAVGTNLILSQDINKSDIYYFNAIITKQDIYHKIFLQYASKNYTSKYNNLSQNNFFQSVQKIQDIISSGDTKAINQIDVSEWFYQITSKINKLEEVDDFLSQEILSLIKTKISNAFIEFLQFVVYSITGLIIVIMVLYLIIELLNRKAKLENMVDKHIIISTTDKRGVITSASQAFCKISGYSKEELIGKPHNIIRHPDMPKEAFKEMWHNIKKGDTWSGTVKNLKKDGGFYIVDAHIEPIYNLKGGIKGYIAIRHDITDKEILKEQIEKNEQQHQQLIHQSRLAQMGEMISMIAHQWRQPLTAISATSSTITLKATIDKLDNETTIKMATKINNYVNHLSTTIEDFRNFFKNNKLKVKVTLDDLINSTLDIIQVSIENKNIKVIKNIQGTYECNTYANEVKQVLLNLLKNAEDALLEQNPADPTIIIETPQNMQAENKVVIVVKDNAGGIPEYIIDKIFDPYFSTKHSKNGTGLGLYMSKTIIEKNCHGKLNVHNDSNGAVFTIELPK